MPKEVVFDLHDYNVGDVTEKLLKIKEHFPNFRCTMFTVPMNVSLLSGDMTIEKYREWAAAVRDYDWIEFALHGFAHMQYEGDTPNRDKAEVLVKASENMMRELGLKASKVWCSPYWVSSDSLYEYLKEQNYIVAIDPNQARPKIVDMKIYEYNWSIDKQPLQDVEVLKAHGHCYGTNNDIGMCMGNVLRNIPTDAEFLFVSEYYAKYGGKT